MISSIHKTSLIDYPGKICTTVFLEKCNFRCPFCHNPDLALSNGTGILSVEEFLTFIQSRNKLIDGVCITGGEPTLHPDLAHFIKQIKQNKFLVKLDTNGSNPMILKSLIKQNLLDYIAMDIKASKENYNLSVGTDAPLKKIEESIALIKNSGMPYEFRTTVVKGHFDENEAKSIGQWLQGAEIFVLQQFDNSNPMIDPKYRNIIPYTPEQIRLFAKILENYFDKVLVKGI
mgnify:CR=1 FL=1